MPVFAVKFPRDDEFYSAHRRCGPPQWWSTGRGDSWRLDGFADVIENFSRSAGIVDEVDDTHRRIPDTAKSALDLGSSDKVGHPSTVCSLCRRAQEVWAGSWLCRSSLRGATMSVLALCQAPAQTHRQHRSTAVSRVEKTFAGNGRASSYA